MSFFNRLKNIIKSNINSDKDIDFADFDVSSSSNVNYDSEKSDFEHEMSDFEKKEHDYYAILEVPYGSDFTAVKSSYRKLLKKYHPDLFHNDNVKYAKAQKLTEKINEAYTYFEKKFS